MKKYRNFNLLLMATLVVLGTSCSKDFLEVDPYGKSDTGTYYSTDQEVTMALTAAYDMLASDQLQGWSSAFLIKQLPADDTNAGGGGASDQLQYQQIDDFNWQSDNSGIKAYYTINYYGIYRCNQLINNTVDNTPLKKRMIAEAKFLRAYYFLEVTTAFGDVPLRLVAAATLTEGIPRTPQAQVYAQIEKDLTEAILELPNKSSYAKADMFRASKQSAQALLGKTYLFAKDYAKSAAAFASVIATEGTEVGLLTDYSTLTKQVSEFGKESLLEASFAGEGKSWGNVGWDRTADDNRHLQLSGPRDFHDGKNKLGYNLVGGWGFNTPTRKLFNILDPADKRSALTAIDFVPFYKNITDSIDSRLAPNAAAYSKTLRAYLVDKDLDEVGADGKKLPVQVQEGLEIDSKIVDAGLAAGAGTDKYKELLVEAVDKIEQIKYNINGWKQEGILKVKYATYSSETTSAGGATPELNYGTNWRLMRYADVLLMAAEAYHFNNNDGQALTELNKVRARAGVANITATGDLLFAAIVKERQVELAFEGFRFWDLVRWGLADQELKGLGFVKGKHEHFPIPMDEMTGNSLIGAQNPGY